MKRYITGAALLLLTLGVSCKKQLDQKPYNAVPTDDVFNTPEGFELAALGMYHQMEHSDNYLGGEDNPIAWVSTPDLLADNLISQQTGRGSQRTFGNWQYNASNTTDMFAQGYRIIRSANAILENIDKLVAPDAVKNNYIGEALAVRGMVHFDLLRVFSKPVSGSQADLNSLGVPYVTTTDITDMPARGTVKETYDNVVKDLTKAATLIADDNGTGRLNKAAVYGLLSRVYLYGGEWQNCVDAATQCLNNTGDVATISQFPDIWTDATESGVIFKIKILESDKQLANSLNPGQSIRIGVGYSQQQANGDIKSEWVCSYSLFQLYDSTDVRKDAYIVQAQSGGITYNAIAKYLGRTDGTAPGILDVKYLRVAEVLLNRAEAYSRMGGNDANALADLNHLRENRYINYTDGTETGQDLQKAILKERRLELAFEGDRWFTLKRLGLPVERDNYGDRADGTGNPYFVKNLPANDKHWEIPLPNLTIQSNSNLQQNPGY